jgi:hypothetical protein
MAWIVMVPHRPVILRSVSRSATRRASQHHSAGIFLTERRALAEKRGLERHDREARPDSSAGGVTTSTVTTRWWPAWKDGHPAGNDGLNSWLIGVPGEKAWQRLGITGLPST